MACMWFVVGTLGRLNVNSLLFFPAVSCMLSFDFRLLIRVLERFSVLSLTMGLASLPGASEAVVMARVSSSGGLRALEDECLRWWICAGDGFGGPAIRAWDGLERAEHDRHVHVLRRINSFA